MPPPSTLPSCARGRGEAAAGGLCGQGPLRQQQQAAWSSIRRALPCLHATNHTLASVLPFCAHTLFFCFAQGAARAGGAAGVRPAADARDWHREPGQRAGGVGAGGRRRWARLGSRGWRHRCCRLGSRYFTLWSRYFTLTLQYARRKRLHWHVRQIGSGPEPDVVGGGSASSGLASPPVTSVYGLLPICRARQRQAAPSGAAGPPPGLPCRPPAQGRLKSLYSTFRKMSRKAVPLSEVYDARALRVVVDDDGGRCAHVCVLVVCVCVHVCVLVVMRGDQR